MGQYRRSETDENDSTLANILYAPYILGQQTKYHVAEYFSKYHIIAKSMNDEVLKIYSNIILLYLSHFEPVDIDDIISEIEIHREFANDENRQYLTYIDPILQYLSPRSGKKNFQEKDGLQPYFRLIEKNLNIVGIYLVRLIGRILPHNANPEYITLLNYFIKEYREINGITPTLGRLLHLQVWYAFELNQWQVLIPTALEFVNTYWQMQLSILDEVLFRLLAAYHHSCLKEDPLEKIHTLLFNSEIDLKLPIKNRLYWILVADYYEKICFGNAEKSINARLKVVETDISDFHPLQRNFDLYCLGNAFLSDAKYDDAGYYYGEIQRLTTTYFEHFSQEMIEQPLLHSFYRLSNMMIAHYYYEIGELEIAKTYFENVVNLVNNFDTVNDSLCLYFLGMIYLKQGRFEKSRQFFQQGLVIINRSQHSSKIFVNQNIISNEIGLIRVHQLLNQHEEALAHIHRIIQSPDNTVFEKIGLNCLAIRSYLELDQLENAERLLDQIRLESVHFDDIVASINQQIILTEALFLKHSNRMLDKGIAQQKLRELLSDTEINYDVEIQARIYLLDLLITELQLLQNETIIDEIDNLLQESMDLARRIHSLSLLAQLLVVKAKLEILNSEYDAGLLLLERALDLANRLNLTSLVSEIKNYQDYLTRNIDYWVTLKEQGFRQRITQSKLLDYLTQANKIAQMESLEKEH